MLYLNLQRWICAFTEESGKEERNSFRKWSHDHERPNEIGNPCKRPELYAPHMVHAMKERLIISTICFSLHYFVQVVSLFIDSKVHQSSHFFSNTTNFEEKTPTKKSFIANLLILEEEKEVICF